MMRLSAASARTADQGQRRNLRPASRPMRRVNLQGLESASTIQSKVIPRSSTPEHRRGPSSVETGWCALSLIPRETPIRFYGGHKWRCIHLARWAFEFKAHFDLDFQFPADNYACISSMNACGLFAHRSASSAVTNPFFTSRASDLSKVIIRSSGMFLVRVCNWE